MLAVKGMDVRANFKEWCSQVFAGETLIISRPKNQNVVMLSQKKYNELLKAQHNAEYLAMIDDSMEQAKAGGIVIKTITDLEQFE